MKRFTNFAVLVCLTVLMTGCFVWVKESCPPDQSPQHMDADPTIAEIDAVRTLTTNESRENVLTAIAERDNLSPRARIHLAKSVDMLTTNESRENVLLTLAENAPQNATPMQAPPADPTIAEIDAARLLLTTNDARQNVLAQIAARPDLSPQARAHLAKSVEMLTTNAARETVLTILAENRPHIPPMLNLPPAPQP